MTKDNSKRWSVVNISNIYVRGKSMKGLEKVLPTFSVLLKSRQCYEQIISWAFIVFDILCFQRILCAACLLGHWLWQNKNVVTQMVSYCFMRQVLTSQGNTTDILLEWDPKKCPSGFQQYVTRLKNVWSRGSGDQYSNLGSIPGHIWSSEHVQIKNSRSLSITGVTSVIPVTIGGYHQFRPWCWITSLVK